MLTWAHDFFSSSTVVFLFALTVLLTPTHCSECNFSDLFLDQMHLYFLLKPYKTTLDCHLCHTPSKPLFAELSTRTLASVPRLLVLARTA